MSGLDIDWESFLFLEARNRESILGILWHTNPTLAAEFTLKLLGSALKGSAQKDGVVQILDRCPRCQKYHRYQVCP